VVAVGLLIAPLVKMGRTGVQVMAAGGVGAARRFFQAAEMVHLAPECSLLHICVRQWPSRR
jgi:hypothetical protein